MWNIKTFIWKKMEKKKHTIQTKYPTEALRIHLSFTEISILRWKSIKLHYMNTNMGDYDKVQAIIFYHYLDKNANPILAKLMTS